MILVFAITAFPLSYRLLPGYPYNNLLGQAGHQAIVQQDHSLDNNCNRCHCTLSLCGC